MTNRRPGGKLVSVAARPQQQQCAALSRLIKYSALLVFIALLGCSQNALPGGSYELQFNRTQWHQADSLLGSENEASVRQKMLGDLIEVHLTGKSRKDVLELLGRPSDKMDPDGQGPAVSYPTGPQRDTYFPIDAEWLIIEFDDHSQYASAHLASD